MKFYFNEGVSDNDNCANIFICLFNIHYIFNIISLLYLYLLSKFTHSIRLRPILDNGALKIRNEKDVFDAVINWVNFNPSKRIPVAHHLLSCVRLRYIPPEQLAEEAEQNDWLLTDVNCLRYCVYEVSAAKTWLCCTGAYRIEFSTINTVGN